MLKVLQSRLTFACSGMSCNSVSDFAFGADDVEIATATATKWDLRHPDIGALVRKDGAVAGAYMASSDSRWSPILSFDNVTFGFKLSQDLDASLASASMIAPTNRLHHVTGTTTIQTIRRPISRLGDH